MTPTGKWNLQELYKLLNMEYKPDQTPSEAENLLIMEQLENSLKEKLIKYYEKIGKKNYTISVKEEVKKIEQMTTEEFEEFMKTLT